MRCSQTAETAGRRHWARARACYNQGGRRWRSIGRARDRAITAGVGPDADQSFDSRLALAFGRQNYGRDPEHSLGPAVQVRWAISAGGVRNDRHSFFGRTDHGCGRLFHQPCRCLALGRRRVSGSNHRQRKTTAVVTFARWKKQHRRWMINRSDSLPCLRP